MSNLLDLLNQSLTGNNVSMISKQIGADEGTTQNAIGAALPMLIGALSKNGSTPQGAESIMGALSKDHHDGHVLDDLPDFIGKKQYEEPRSGAGILGHLFGGKKDMVERGVSKASGLDASGTDQLMKMLAPMVLGALGKKQKSQGFDAGSMMDFLGGEKKSVEKESGGMIGRLLDQDGDGDFDISDVAKFAMGKLFGSKS